jgi:hypothetical protein
VEFFSLASAGAALAIITSLLGILKQAAEERRRFRRARVGDVQVDVTALNRLNDLEPGEALKQIAAEATAGEPQHQLLAGLEHRIRGIEERFPSASTIDKVASVNDAILATKLEALQKEVDQLRSSLDQVRAQAVGKWTVAAISAGMIVGLVGIVAAVIQGMEYLKP